jgi:hypothetical protein
MYLLFFVWWHCLVVKQIYQSRFKIISNETFLFVCCCAGETCVVEVSSAGTNTLSLLKGLTSIFTITGQNTKGFFFLIYLTWHIKLSTVRLFSCCRYLFEHDYRCCIIKFYFLFYLFIYFFNLWTALVFLSKAQERFFSLFRYVDMFSYVLVWWWVV